MKKIKFLVITAFFCLAAFFVQSVVAEQKIEPSYMNVHIFEGDTLWSIASEHPHDGLSIHAYIREIKVLNDLKTDNIRTGALLIIPVYRQP